MIDIAGMFDKLEEGLEYAKIERARRDPVYFGHYCFRNERGEPWIIGDPLHYEWQRFIPLKGPWQGVILGFRESMKTSQIGFCRVLWELGHNPNLRVKYVTCNDDKARDHLRWVKENIESNERLHAVFPDLRPGSKRDWLANKIVIASREPGLVRDVSLEVSGITSNASGGRADLMIFDDIIDYKTVIMQPRMHEAIVGHFRNTWLAQGAAGRRIVVIGIPTTSDDLLAQLAQDPAWHTFAKPAYIEHPDGTLEATFPQYWPLERLLEQRAAIGDRAFRRQFLLQAISPDERYFSQEGINRCLCNWEIGANVNPDWPRYGGVDIAQSLKKKASYTVIFIIAVEPGTGRRHPVEILRAKLRPGEVKQAVVQLARQHNVQRMLVENNAMQEAVVQWCQEMAADIPVYGHFTGSNKWDPEVGVPRLVSQIENGAWVIPLSAEHRNLVSKMHQHLDVDMDNVHCPVCAWKLEMEQFPLGPTADTIMAMWLADAAATQHASRKVGDWLPTVIGTTRRVLPTGWRR